MSTSAISGGSAQALSYMHQANAKVTARDSDGDHDNDATESSAAKAAEAAKSQPLPSDPAKGRNLNILA